MTSGGQRLCGGVGGCSSGVGWGKKSEVWSFRVKADTPTFGTSAWALLEAKLLKELTVSVFQPPNASCIRRVEVLRPRYMLEYMQI